MSDTDTEGQLEQFVDDSSPDDIEKAKAIGWKSQSDWKGPPPRGKFWKAKEFLERAETVIPIMKETEKKLRAELAEAKAEIKTVKDGFETRVAKLAQMSKVALDRQRTQLEDKYDTAIAAAAEVGDKAEVKRLTDASRKDLKEFDAASDEAAEVKADNKEKAKETVNSALPKDVQDDISEWLSVNTWYHTDPEMQALANAHEGKLHKEKPGLTTTERLEEVRKYVARRFPEKFGKHDDEDEPDENERPARSSRVEGGSRVPGGNGGSKFSKLPADAKEQCDKFIKEHGQFLEKGETAEKDLSKARERYAAKYLES